MKAPAGNLPGFCAIPAAAVLKARVAFAKLREV